MVSEAPQLLPSVECQLVPPLSLFSPPAPCMLSDGAVPALALRHCPKAPLRGWSVPTYKAKYWGVRKQSAWWSLMRKTTSAASQEPRLLGSAFQCVWCWGLGDGKPAHSPLLSIPWEHEVRMASVVHQVTYSVLTLDYCLVFIYSCHKYL